MKLFLFLLLFISSFASAELPPREFLINPPPISHATKGNAYEPLLRGCESDELMALKIARSWNGDLPSDYYAWIERWRPGTRMTEVTFLIMLQDNSELLQDLGAFWHYADYVYKKIKAKDFKMPVEISQ